MNAFSHACGAGQRLITVFLFCFLLPAWAQSAEMVVGEAIQHDTSASLRDMAAVVPEFAGDKVVSIRERAKLGRFPDLAELDGGLQETEASPLGGLVPTPTPLISVEGLSDDDNAAIVGGRIVPPDVNGDIGLDGSGNRIYIQYINLIWAIYNANTGALIEGPFVGNSFWQGFGGYCEFNNDGDPIVLYDDHAGRWFFSQFSINEGIQCVAVSATGDPMGAYHRYAFLLTPNGANDYPKLGVWDDGTAGSSGQSAYTFTLRDFGGAGGSFSVSAGVLERDAILAGQPAKRVKFINPCTGTDCIEGQLPPHMDGAQAPAGTCPTFWTAVDAAYDDSPHASDGYRNHTLCVDWNTTSNSTYTEGPLVPAGSNFDRFLGNGFSDCISPVEGGGEDLDCLAAFTMYRAQYRWLGSQASVVLNTTVDAGGDRAGIRWAEVRSADGDSGWFRQQDGTYAPGDGRDRWMGSIAQDRDGNIALGYAVTGPGLLPSVAYTSRTAGDTAGTLPGGEVICHEGTGVQVGSSNRWGDYSSMSIDPTDDCTFWYTQEYISSPGVWGNWSTRIGSFRFPDCMGPTGTLQGIVVEDGTGKPIAGAKVTASAGRRYVSHTQPVDGSYRFEAVPSGIYTLSATAYAYQPQTFAGVHIPPASTVSRDFSLSLAASYVLSGNVIDGATGWPLYASIEIDGYPGDTFWTDPATGFYSVSLAADTPYTLTVKAWVEGYQLSLIHI